MTELQEQSAPTEDKQSQTLKIAGWSYLIGDAALYVAGRMENKGAQWVGLLWGAGGVGAALFGNPKPEKQLELLSHDLRDYLQQHNITIPTSRETLLLTDKGGISERVQSFLHKHPSEVLNIAYGLGAIQMAHSGRKSGKYGDIASGILVGAGALAGLLIPEKKLAPGQKAETWKEWVQEKPLRVTGSLYALNNIAMLHSAHESYQNGQKSYIPRCITAASYIFANAMLFLSSRGQTDDSKNDIASQLANTAAHVIAAQPEFIQKALMLDISEYMAQQPGIHHTADTIAGMLQTKLASITLGRWQQAAAQTDSSITR
jgi:hypothetical protein